MKKTLSVILAFIMIFSFASCGKRENRADTTLKEGEMMLSGFVAESYGTSLLLQKAEGYDWQEHCSDRVFVSIGDNTEFVTDGGYVTDLTADYFEGKYISVICNEIVLETYPGQLQDERMIILLD